jgi:hypothetical protein
MKSLNDYIAASKLSKSHFCARILQANIAFIKNDYYKYPEIHYVEFNSIIALTDKFISGFIGDLTVYNNIITNYGNTKFLEFILRVYRFGIKCILKWIPK